MDGLILVSLATMLNFRELEWVELGYLMVEDNKKNKKTILIDFRGYPSPQLELELSWQVGAKVDQLTVLRLLPLAGTAITGGIPVHIDIQY